MSLIAEYGLDSASRTLLTLALSIKDKRQQKAMDILHIQKIIRYFEYLRQRNEIDFSNYHLGGVSYELEENIETLRDCGLVDKTDNRYVLSEMGEQAAKELENRLEHNELQKLAFAKNQLNDLPTDELMFFMYKLLPETQRYSTEFARLNEKKDLIVRNLFLKARINASTAAKWMGTSEKDFLLSLPKTGQK